MIKEFKEFIMRGNVLDLAVGVVIGGAFTAIVSAIVEGLITPLVVLAIKLITRSNNGTDDIEKMSVAIYGVPFNYGQVLSAIITFLITAFVVFLIVKGFNTARTIVEKSAEEEVEEEEEVKEEIEISNEYLKEIRDLLSQQNKK